jgi:hypothetical protein
MSSFTSSSLCIRIMCCLKLSRRGQILSWFLQLGEAHLKLVVIVSSPIPCLLFLCLIKSLIVLNPSTRVQPMTSHLLGLSCFSMCFLGTYFQPRLLMTRVSIGRTCSPMGILTCHRTFRTSSFPLCSVARTSPPLPPSALVEPKKIFLPYQSCRKRELGLKILVSYLNILHSLRTG